MSFFSKSLQIHFNLSQNGSPIVLLNGIVMLANGGSIAWKDFRKREYNGIFALILRILFIFEIFQQENFIWQELWKPLFEVRWNDHFVNYFYLMNRWEINTNLLLLAFSSAISCNIFWKNNWINNLYKTSCRSVTIFYRQ